MSQASDDFMQNYDDFDEMDYGELERPTPPCPYCKKSTLYVEDSHVYRKSYGGELLICSAWPVCDAYVGCHRHSGWPKGTLANGELRLWRRSVHGQFDPIWTSYRGDKSKARSALYVWLADKMGIQLKNCHIGMFTIEQCEQAIKFIQFENVKTLLRGLIK